MNKAVVLTAFCGWLLALPAPIRAVTITSQDISVVGSWKEINLDAEQHSIESTGTFNHSSTSSLTSHNASAPKGKAEASVAIQGLQMEIDAHASSDSGTHLWDQITFTAKSSIRFGVDATTSTLSVNWNSFMSYNYRDDEQFFRIELKDLTTGQDLLGQSFSRTREEGAFAYQVAVDSSHSFEFNLIGWVNAFDSKMETLNSSVEIGEVLGLGAANARVSDVTDPAWLMAMGLAVLGLANAKYGLKGRA